MTDVSSRSVIFDKNWSTSIYLLALLRGSLLADFYNGTLLLIPSAKHPPFITHPHSSQLPIHGKTLVSLCLHTLDHARYKGSQTLFRITQGYICNASKLCTHWNVLYCSTNICHGEWLIFEAVMAVKIEIRSFLVVSPFSLVYRSAYQHLWRKCPLHLMRRRLGPLILKPEFSLKSWHVFAELHGVMSQKTVNPSLMSNLQVLS